MKLTYVFGRSGSGKTTFILNKIAETIKNQDCPGIIYLVPEQFSLQAEKNLLDVLDNGASVDAQVLSFARLAHQIYKRTGGISKTVLDETGKSMLLRKIVYELSNSLMFFNKIADKDGFIKSLSGSVTELYQYDISPQTLAECLDKLNDDYLTVKMKDILNIYSHFREYIDSGFMTADNILSFLPEKIESSDYLTGTHIFLDGFTGFTPQEYRIISSLLKKASQITIALTSLDNNTYYEFLDASDPFYETKSTVNKLTVIASDAGALVTYPHLLSGNFRFKNNPLEFLGSNYLSYKRESFADTQNEISIIKTQNKYEEVEEAAKSILRLSREEVYRYNDIAILTASVGDYSSIIKSVFDKYQIPVFIDERVDILSNPITELFRSLIDIAAYNYAYEPVFRFLKTGLTSVMRPEFQYLENYVLSYGIDGYKWRDLKYWQNGYVKNDEVDHCIKGSFNKADIISARERFIAIVSPLVDISGRKQKAVCFAKSVFEVIQNTLVIQTLEESEESENNQVWGKICQLFDKFTELLGDTEISIKEFGKIIEAGLKACDFGVVPPTGDNVVIGDLERSRLPNIKALLVLGVNEGVIPRIREEDSLLSDAERNLLFAHGVELSPDSKKLTSREEFVVYNALTRPSDKLLLSYQTGGMDGKTLRPSSVISKIKKLFPNIKESGTQFEYTLPVPMFNEIGEFLSRNSKVDERKDKHDALIEWYSKSPGYREKIIKMRRILAESTRDERLKEETIKSLYKERIKTSASQLQKYSECPFSYFMRYNLNAKERKIYEAKAVDIGNIFHTVFDEFYKLVQRENLSWAELTKEQISDFVDECFNNQTVLDKSDIMLSSEETKYRLGSIKAAAEKSLWALAIHLKNGDFRPVASELKFGTNEPLTAIRVAINDKHAFEVSGSIDRVDITSHSGDTYVKILDYKTGSTKFNPTDIYYGRQMQLILYLKALTDTKDFMGKFSSAESRMLPGGIFYFNIKDPVIAPEEAEHSDEAMLKAFKLNGLVLKDKQIVEKMDEQLPEQKTKSDIVPVEMKKDGEFSKRTEATVREQGDFEYLVSFVMTKVASIGTDMLNGNITPKPYKSSTINACNFCQYSSVCGFGTTDRLSRYNFAGKARAIEDMAGKADVSSDK